jgi:hypothetical protein
MYTLTCETQQTRWHSPNRLPRTCQTRRHSPNHLPRTRQTGRHSPSRLPSTRHTRRHLPKAIFEKNVTRLDKFAQVTCESREFGVSGHSLISIQIFNYFFTNSSKHLIKFLAAIKNNQRPKTFHFRLKKLHKRKIIQLSAVRTAESWIFFRFCNFLRPKMKRFWPLVIFNCGRKFIRCLLLFIKK